MKRITFLTAAFLCLSGLTESPAQDTQSNRNMEELKLTQEWDKTFPKSDKVNHSKVTFVNRYGITLAADLYVPKTTAGGKLPAIAVSGAVCSDTCRTGFPHDCFRPLVYR